MAVKNKYSGTQTEKNLEAAGLVNHRQPWSISIFCIKS